MSLHYFSGSRLCFPTSTATAALIGLLHDDDVIAMNIKKDKVPLPLAPPDVDLFTVNDKHDLLLNDESGDEVANRRELKWQQNVKHLSLSFFLSGIFVGQRLQYTHRSNYNDLDYCIILCSCFGKHPNFGLTAARKWLWALNISPAFISYGMIMDTATVVHMVIGAVLGWGILSPIAKHNGWAPGDVGDWGSGSRGWIIWASLGFILGDSVVGICWLVIQPLVPTLQRYRDLRWLRKLRSSSYTAAPTTDTAYNHRDSRYNRTVDKESNDERLVDPKSRARALDFWISSNKAKEPYISSMAGLCWLVVSFILCISAMWLVYGRIVPSYAVIFVVVLVLPLRVVSLRALGETDVAPVEGISKSFLICS